MLTRYSAGIVPIRYAESGLPELLMLRVYKLWDFPKGMLEGDEDHLTAAIRELEEETTLVECNFRWGHDFVETGPYSQGKFSRYFIAECSLDVSCRGAYLSQTAFTSSVRLD